MNWTKKIQPLIESHQKLIFSDRLQTKMFNFRQKFIGNIMKPLILTDFDHTCTSFTNQNRVCPATMGVIRNSGFVEKNFCAQLETVFQKYHPLEHKISISNEEKAKIIHEWNQEIRKIYRKNQIPVDVIPKALDATDIRFRHYLTEYLNTTYQNDIPTIILSGGVQQII